MTYCLALKKAVPFPTSEVSFSLDAPTWKVVSEKSSDCPGGKIVIGQNNSGGNIIICSPNGVNQPTITLNPYSSSLQKYLGDESPLPQLMSALESNGKPLTLRSPLTSDTHVAGAFLQPQGYRTFIPQISQVSTPPVNIINQPNTYQTPFNQSVYQVPDQRLALRNNIPMQNNRVVYPVVNRQVNAPSYNTSGYDVDVSASTNTSINSSFYTQPSAVIVYDNTPKVLSTVTTTTQSQEIVQ